ncbi:MAG: DUF4132 domain-containing protein [Ruminiclostridium sp.]|nr:DUF4132 domain-containing protein [Ruminiclostridium sp.]
MKIFSKEEQARIFALGDDYNKKLIAEKGLRRKKIGKEYLSFIEISEDDSCNETYNIFCQALIEGKIKKPSEFFKKGLFRKNGSSLIGTAIRKERAEDFLYYIDHLEEYPYSVSAYRRSFRTADRINVAERVREVVRTLWRFDDTDADICDILEENLPEEQIGYRRRYRYSQPELEIIIAAEIDLGNKRLIKLLTDVISCESDVFPSAEMIKGIVKSHNNELHILLGKMLLAARLQEGLRQAICENIDCGTAMAFSTLFKVIEENDLIRYSSVKRAVGTWLGLINPDTRDLERVSAKTVRLICECLCDMEKRKEYLKAEDSMQIYVALWSCGFYEVTDMMNQIRLLIIEGSRHQALTAGYAARNIDNKGFCHFTGAMALAKYQDDTEMLAVYLPCFMNDVSSKIRTAVRVNSGAWVYCDGGYRYVANETNDYSEKTTFPLSDYFKNDEGARTYYEILKNIRSNVKNKELTFSPCIFPWFSASLEKSDIALRLCAIAGGLNDNKITDEAVAFIPEIQDGRFAALTLLLTKPETILQRKALTSALCDKESYTRSTAFEVIKKAELDDENYLQMEEMLRYKAADARGNLISLILARDDNSVYASIERLLSDKKEERRTAALDMVMLVSKDETRTELYLKCIGLVKKITSPTTKEKILIEGIIGTGKEEEIKAPLFTVADKYIPVVSDNDFYRSCVDRFMQVFPSSAVGNILYPDSYKKPSAKGECAEKTEIYEKIGKLCALIEAHGEDEFRDYCDSEIYTVGSCSTHQFYTKDENGRRTVPLMDVWQKWFDDNVTDEAMLIRLYLLISVPAISNDFTDFAKKFIDTLYGKGFSEYTQGSYSGKAGLIVSELMLKGIGTVLSETCEKLAVAIALWLCKVADEDLVYRYTVRGYANESVLYSHNQISGILTFMRVKNDERAEYILPLIVTVYNRTVKRYEELKGNTARYLYSRFNGLNSPDIYAYIIAAYRGIISEKALYCFIYDSDNTHNALSVLSNIAKVLKEKGRLVASRERYWSAAYKEQAAFYLVSKKDRNEPFTEEETKLLRYAESIYEKVIERILSTELKRGDTKTEYSEFVRSISRIYGMENFVAILSAMGKDTLERSAYSTETKRASLSHLLGVCVPYEDENCEKLRELLKDTDITEKRLIEAALYSAEWVDIVGEYLGWKGFVSGAYYFMAHMNESFDDKRKAIIAKYTPLSEIELNDGAFDVDWFNSAYSELGAKRFDMLYNAAKYISDGAKHSRARKYADAVLGKMDAEETAKTISDKRNKDLVMAYALIPLKDEEDIITRYLFLQQFLKESKKFGAQRIASEKKAVEIAMQNLSMNAGYDDVTRLTLRMETKLVEDNRSLFEGEEIDGVIVRLSVDDDGKAAVVCEKDGKTLKSVPAKLKKNEFLLKASDMKKKLTEQYRRTKAMFEAAMENYTGFTFGELVGLLSNPVIKAIIGRLVFESDGRYGVISENGISDTEGNTITLSTDSVITVVHPIRLFKDKCWSAWQKYIFDNRIAQPFKQIFREIYLPTEEENQAVRSLRYAGNQIQPKKAAACLKTRKWVADIEDGLQKVYYKEDIIACIYAMADWFSPSDIEAPTLEWVAFYDRKNGRELKLCDIPEIIFSEVMRDVDMAVSVAHVGGVDPEASHSTIEMRSAVISCTLPLFRLTNVTLKGNHAHIKGKYGEYTIHLGSGVIHMVGGTMIAVLPVHSQHRGKLFLPFIDDDPKTSEILTKILFFAEDNKIKDPAILSQIQHSDVIS